MNELRDLLRRYQQPLFDNKKDLLLGISTLSTVQVNIRYGIKSLSRLAMLAAQDDEYSPNNAKQDLYHLSLFINTLMDVLQFTCEEEEDITIKLDAMEKQK